MTTEQFFALARKRSPRTAAKIDAAIHKACAAELTVVCCDSAGFSRKTHEHGIIEFMDNMVKCHDGLEKIVHRMGGVTLSNKADNLMLIFEEPLKAVACSIEMHRWLKRRNKPLPDFKKYNICVGIHHGHLLRFADDAYGAAVNVAFKLGGRGRQGRAHRQRAGQRPPQGSVPHRLLQACHHRRHHLRRLQGQVPLTATEKEKPRRSGAFFFCPTTLSRAPSRRRKPARTGRSPGAPGRAAGRPLLPLCRPPAPLPLL